MGGLDVYVQGDVIFFFWEKHNKSKLDAANYH